MAGHRNANGEISRKHGNSQVAGLRRTYGDSFAKGTRCDAKPSTVLNRIGADSLTNYLKK